MNCWEYRKCGREEGGANSKELGVCPAFTDARMDRVHGGQNAGRACWVVAGTFCGGKVQGTFAEKSRSCLNCEFYLKVRAEEGRGFKILPDLLRKLRESA